MRFSWRWRTDECLEEPTGRGRVLHAMFSRGNVWVATGPLIDWCAPGAETLPGSIGVFMSEAVLVEWHSSWRDVREIPALALRSTQILRRAFGRNFDVNSASPASRVSALLQLQQQRHEIDEKKSKTLCASKNCAH